MGRLHICKSTVVDEKSGNTALFFPSIYRFKVITLFINKSLILKTSKRTYNEKHSKIEEENDIFLFCIIKIYNASL